jgi:hypothetical protein
MAAGRARAHGGDAHKGHSGFERARWKRRGTRAGLYSPKALRVRKGKIETRDSTVANKEGDDGVDLRRKAALTCGPTVSTRETERRGGRGRSRAS